jgi:hypothetical protein
VPIGLHFEGLRFEEVLPCFAHVLLVPSLSAKGIMWRRQLGCSDRSPPPPTA